ncbi:MAG: sulfite exporter TauE/SafE family protein [Oscillospiraceae bacterium]
MLKRGGDFAINIIIEIIAAVLSGLMGSLGLGGGTILIIYLTTFASINQLNAQGINLMFFIPCAITAIFFHNKNKLIKWKIVGLIVLGGIIGTFIGVYIANYLNGIWLRKIFGAFLLYIGIRQIKTKK